MVHIGRLHPLRRLDSRDVHVYVHAVPLLADLPMCTQIVLSEQQREEKKAAEAELAFARSELEKEVDPTKSKVLREEVILMEKKLDELLSSFEVWHSSEAVFFCPKNVFGSFGFWYLRFFWSYAK
jgi:hypothetical protein